MVYTPPLKDPETPAGKAPEEIDAPVALPPTVYVIFVIALLIHFVCVFVPAPDDKTIVEFDCIVRVPLAVTLVQGPVVVIV